MIEGDIFAIREKLSSRFPAESEGRRFAVEADLGLVLARPVLWHPDGVVGQDDDFVQTAHGAKDL